MVKNKENLLKFIALMVFIICGIAAIFFITNVESTSPGQKTYQWIGDVKYEYKEDTKAVKTKEGLFMKEGKTKYPLGNTPLYFSEENGMILTSTMSVIFPNSGGKSRKLRYFSKIYGLDQGLTAESKEGVTKIEECFLYDGKDTYVFLEPVVLTYGEHQVALDPYSFVIVRYNQVISYYIKQEDRFISMDTGICTVRVEAQSGYDIDLGVDVLYRDADGQQQILITEPEMLDPLD